MDVAICQRNLIVVVDVFSLHARVRVEVDHRSRTEREALSELLGERNRHCQSEHLQAREFRAAFRRIFAEINEFAVFHEASVSRHSEIFPVETETQPQRRPVAHRTPRHRANPVTEHLV